MEMSRYKQIRARLAFNVSALPNVVLFALQVLILAGANAMAATGSWLAYVACACVLGIVAMQGFGMVHEGAHGLLSTKPLFNWLLSHWGGALAAMPATPYRNGHMEHHIWVGNTDRDPVLRVLHHVCRTPGFAQRALRICWRLWIPLLAAVQLLTLWIYPLRLIATLAGFRKLIEELTSIATIIGFWYLLSQVFPHLFVPQILGPSLLVYLVLTELISFPHHNDIPTFVGQERLPLNEQYRVTRTCTFPFGLGTLLCMNFNLHIEHHLFPNLPWHQLPRARTLILQQLGEKYNDTAGIEWDIKNRKKDAVSAIVGLYSNPK